jgi:hypothetical protein
MFERGNPPPHPVGATPPSDLMDDEQLKQWLLRRLGAPLWKVELTEDHLNDEVELAKRWFSAKKGVIRQLNMPLYTNVPVYELPTTVDIVTDVAFPGNPMDISLVFSPYILQGEKVPYDVFAAPSAAGIYSSYTQTVQYIEMAKRILNAEPDWRQEGRLLHVFPMPKCGGFMIIDYKSHDFNIQHLSERDHDLVKRYALAKAKLDLATMRSKHGEYAGAQGATTFNWQQMEQQGNAEIEVLDKEIGQSGMPMLFLHG